MLFYLTDSLIIDINDQRYNQIYKAVRNLAIAADESHHMLLGDIKALEFWNQQLGNDPCAAVLVDLINNYSTTTIPIFITEYVEVVLEYPQDRAYNGKHIYQLLYTSFTNSQNLSPTYLIGEDENDSKFYGHILNWYKRINNINSNISFNREGGGGHNTYRTFNTHIEQNHICICIVDTDRRYPGAPEGETAKNCRNNVVCTPPYSQLLVINVHEIENLLPKDIIDSLDWPINKHPNKEAFDELYTNIPDKENLRYVDLKSGYSKHQKFSSDASWVSFANYCCTYNTKLPPNIRNNFQAAFDSMNMGDLIMCGLSSTLLKDTLAFFEGNPIYDPTNFLHFQLNEWTNIGKALLNTCISRNSETLNI